MDMVRSTSSVDVLRMQFEEQVRQRIGAIRKSLGWSQERLAERAGTTNQTIGRLEGGKRRITLEWVDRLAGALGVEPFELLVTDGIVGQPEFVAATLPARGLAKCGLTGWFDPKPDGQLPRPVGFSDPEAFYVEAIGASMAPEGIEPGDYCLVAPSRPETIGDRVWVEDTAGHVSIKRLVEADDEKIVLRGWMQSGRAKEPTPFNEERPRRAITSVAPIVAVYDAKPSLARTPHLRPDPRKEPRSQQEKVPLLGFVEVGGAVVYDRHPTHEASPPDASGEFGCLEVRGDAAYPAVRDRDRVYVRLTPIEPNQCVGRIVAATDTSGDTWLKVLRRGDEPSTWNLESINRGYPTMENVSLQRVLSVDWIRCRGAFKRASNGR